MECAGQGLPAADTGSTLDETDALFLQETMDLVQEAGQPLHLVDNDPLCGRKRSQFICEPARTCQQPLLLVLGREIDRVRVREGLP